MAIANPEHSIRYIHQFPELSSVCMKQAQIQIADDKLVSTNCKFIGNMHVRLGKDHAWNCLLVNRCAKT